MVVHDLHVERVAVTPDEADAELVVHANRVLSVSISSQGLKTIARWHAQVVQTPRVVEVAELPPGHALDRLEPKHGSIPEQRLRVLAPKGPDHEAMILRTE